MTQPFTEIHMKQGSNFSIDMQCYDDESRANANISGLQVRSQMRRNYTNVNSTITFTVSNLDLNNGIFTLSATANQTMNVYQGTYVMDVELYDDLGNVYNILDGLIEVTPEATK